MYILGYATRDKPATGKNVVGIRLKAKTFEGISKCLGNEYLCSRYLDLRLT